MEYGNKYLDESHNEVNPNYYAWDVCKDCGLSTYDPELDPGEILRGLEQSVK